MSPLSGGSSRYMLMVFLAVAVQVSLVQMELVLAVAKVVMD